MNQRHRPLLGTEYYYIVSKYIYIQIWTTIRSIVFFPIFRDIMGLSVNFKRLKVFPYFYSFFFLNEHTIILIQHY